MRATCSEIIYYYKKYGNINVADFYTYVQEKEEILEFLKEVLSGDYNETIEKEELVLYFDVAKEFTVKSEIKRLKSIVPQSCASITIS